MTDGNTDAINRHLAEREEYDLERAQPVKLLLVMADAQERIEELEAKLRKCAGALGDISNGEPEWPDDPQKELDWCRNRATTTLAELKRAKR